MKLLFIIHASYLMSTKNIANCEYNEQNLYKKLIVHYFENDYILGDLDYG